jgi:hypothetical protein
MRLKVMERGTDGRELNMKSPASKARRAERWDKGDIRCISHPNRTCNRSLYVPDGDRKCCSCSHRRADGTLRMTPADVRHQREKSYNKGLKKRLHSLGNGNTLRGLKLFKRVTGFG